MQELINDFMKNFYGYGNLNGQYWFIGMEEGCGPDWDKDVKPRFEYWEARKRKQTEDLRDFHFSIGIRNHWEPIDGRPIKVQFTWKRLIETILAATGGIITSENIVDYQSKHLGTLDGNNCLLELLPLPSPNVREFGFKHLANEEFPFFASRAKYRKHIMQARIDAIRNLISDKKPRHIVLYGLTYERQWSDLVKNANWKTLDNFVKCCRISESHVWLVPHPAAHNIPRKLFEELGERMKKADHQPTICD
ncbi:hypothetical protein GJV26_16755 [Massilia dura]|uniref:Uracil-DNA glycosylase-like domain-containing protein n=1 Tax=Pseudoduganella dura TaxID=321982 RepID=A0A6I3XAZ9_9BURK|nr:hypothetical protein [Pseudoduganella dura]MUI14094.1 hypothetical protein [Pseudoduganella dura]GGX77165.1 hypothetical protein GCM10007386_05500 [Pseudoduganella dura]